MNARQGKSISWRRSVVVWVCIGLLAAALSVSSAGQWIERTIVREWIFQLRGVRPPPKEVAIVSMDKSAADLPAVVRGGRLWSRYLYSSLINQLSAAQASAIILDVTFEDAGDETADNALEASLASSNRVVLFQRLSRIEGNDVPIVPLSRFASVVRAQAVFPLPKLLRVDDYWPFFPARDVAGSVERYQELPSLPVAALQLRLVDEIGIAAFEQLLGAVPRKEANHINAGRQIPGDVSSLISKLREKVVGSRISGDVVGSLIPDQIDDGSPTATMLRSLIQVYGRKGLLPLNFYGPSRTIKTIDHMLVLSEESGDIQSLHKAVSGKVVFIGHSSKMAVDQKDGFRTVYTQDGLDLSGVEIAATAYANLTDGSVLRFESTPVTVMIHVALALMTGYLALRASIFQAVVFTAVLAIGYFVFAVLLFTHAYILLPIGVPLLLLLPFTLFATLLFRYFGSDRQIGVYRHGIELLLPSRVMADIESGHLEQAAHAYLHGTCMITDIANFTHYSEEQGCERIANLSREYFSLVMGEVYSSGGELFDVEGDGITAFWGHPVVTVESGQRAASAAFQIIRNVALFNQQHPDTPFETRIGLDSGWVEATYIGGEGNYRYCLVGDVANTSSRLEGLNKRLGTSVLASKAVVSEAETLLLRPVGVFLLKGKNIALEVVEIMDYQESATTEERALCTRFTEALEWIAKEQFELAEKVLVDILLDYGTDGPSSFYLELLNDHNSPEVHLGKRGVVRVDGK